MESLICVVEIWLPSSDEERLVWGGGSYGEGLDEFRRASDALSFTTEDGALGNVWKSRSTTILTNADLQEMPRGDLAAKAGLTSGIAIPVVAGDRLVAIVLMLCRTPDDAQAAIEVWRLNRMQELSIQEDVYTNLDRFESLSRQIRFPRGAGLPGRVWDETRPLIVNDLAHAPGFARPAALGAEALEVGVGLPIMQGSLVLDSVILLISAKETPLAERFEVWMREDEDQDFTCMQIGPVPDEDDDSENCQTLIKEVASRRLPIAKQNGNRWELGLPVFVGQHLSSIVALVG